MMKNVNCKKRFKNIIILGVLSKVNLGYNFMLIGKKIATIWIKLLVLIICLHQLVLF